MNKPSDIVRSPEKFCHQPETLQAAWFALCAKRGILVRPERLKPRHDIRPAPAPVNPISARLEAAKPAIAAAVARVREAHS